MRRLRALALAFGALLATTAAAPVHLNNRIPQRIVSLSPVTTEELFAVGAGDRVVGVSEFSDYPPQAKRLPTVNSFSSVATERVVELHPDLVLGIAAQRAATADLRRAGVRVVLLDDDSYASIFDDLETIGRLTGEAPRADGLVAHLRAQTTALLRTVPRRADPPRVFVVLGTDPIYTVGGGSYIDTLIRMAGGRNVAGDVHEAYVRFSPETLIARQPDALIVDPTVGLQTVLGRPPWSALRAVREHHVDMLPDAALLERPGPRYTAGLSWLIAALAKTPG
jgi:iron complex transport system substrate-binding protein